MIRVRCGLRLVFRVSDTQQRRCTPKSAENYRKLGNNYGIGFMARVRVRYRVGLVLLFRVSDTQWHYGALVLLCAIVCFIWTPSFVASKNLFIQ